MFPLRIPMSRICSTLAFVFVSASCEPSSKDTGSPPGDSSPPDTSAPTHESGAGETAHTGDTASIPADGDGDGFEPPEDCDDADADVHPGAEDLCGDGVDQDCDGGDQRCTFEGLYSASDAAAQVSDCGNYDRLGTARGVGDWNGDGYEDLLVSCNGDYSYVLPASANVFYGPVSGTVAAMSADIRLQGTEFSHTGLVVGPSADWDGDGSPDLALAASNADLVFLFQGPVTADTDFHQADSTLSGIRAFGLVRVGDMNADGVPELGVTSTDLGGAAIFAGPVASGTSADALALVTGSAAGLGYALSTGDTNGDGFDDLALAAPGVPAAYVVLGPVSGDVNVDTAAAELTSTASAWSTAAQLELRGDTDGDGYADLMVADDESGRRALRLISGPVTASSRLMDATTHFEAAEPSGQMGPLFGYTGDLNDDLRDDLLLSEPGADDAGTDAGAAHLFLGPVPAGTLTGADAQASFFGASAGDGLQACGQRAGDVDGDGRADLLLCTPGLDSSYGEHVTGRAWLFLGADY